MDPRTIKKIGKLKQKVRTDIKLGHWNRFNYHETVGDDLEKFKPDFIRRVHVDDISQKEFIESYEKPRRPCMLKGICEKWPAWKRWLPENFQSVYKDVKFKCGEDDEGYAVRIKLKYFMEYMRNQKDDSPVYLFESSFDDRKFTKDLLLDYNVPKFFRENIFNLLNDKIRPPYRWFLIGPKYSGTTVHLDPLSTNAWNALLYGRKRWVLFSPNTPRHVVKGIRYFRKGDDDEAVPYFHKILPKIRRDNELRENVEMFEFIQYPGEIIFVPHGWWHAVVNLDDTVAVTQNYGSYVNFENVWRKVRRGRKRLAVKLLQKFRKHCPRYADLAESLNREDNYEMYDKAKHSKKRKRRKEAENNTTTSSSSDTSSSPSSSDIDDGLICNASHVQFPERIPGFKPVKLSMNKFTKAPKDERGKISNVFVDDSGNPRELHNNKFRSY